MQRPLGTHLPGYSTPQRAWAGHTQGNCPDRRWPAPSEEQTIENTIVWYPAYLSSIPSRPWVLCQDAEVYQQCLLCDSTTETRTLDTPGRSNQHPAQAGDAQQVPNTAQNPPGIPSSLHPSATIQGVIMAVVSVLQKPSLRVTRTNLSEFTMRETALPSTHCANC